MVLGSGVGEAARMRTDGCRRKPDSQDSHWGKGQWLLPKCSLQVTYPTNVFVEERILSIAESMVSAGKASQKGRLHSSSEFTIVTESDFLLFC